MKLSDELRQAAWDAIHETGTLQLIAAHCRHAFGWTGSQATAAARLAQWLNPRDKHALPAEALVIIISCTGRDPFTPILLRAGMKRIRKPPKGVELEKGRRVA